MGLKIVLFLHKVARCRENSPRTFFLLSRALIDIPSGRVRLIFGRLHSFTWKTGFMNDISDKSPATTMPAPKGDSDLSRDIERAVEKEPSDRVKCVRVFGERYRCNWWAPAVGAVSNPAFDWAVVTTHHIRKSQFFSASNSTGQLIIAKI
jgi:hypothetical protein